MMVQRRFFSIESAALTLAAIVAHGALLHGQAPAPSSGIGRSANFLSGPAFSLDGTPSSMVAADLNGDGKPDLIVASASDGTVRVYLGTGAGSFAAPVQYRAGGHPSFITTADITGDGKLDIITANESDGTVSVLPGIGDGTLATSRVYATGIKPRFLSVSDLNEDGSQDVVVGSYTGQALAVLLNDRQGGLLKAAVQSLGKTPVAMTVGKFSDQHTDIALANNDGTVLLLKGSGDGTFHLSTSFATGATRLTAVLAGDFNQDGKTDLVVAQADGPLLTIFTGRGDATFASGASYIVGNNPSSILAADINGDGIADLISMNQGSNTYSVLLSAGDGSFVPAGDFTVGDGPLALAAGDFQGSGKTGLAVLNASAKTVSIIAGNGDGSFLAAPSYRGNVSPRAIASGDLNGDGLPDLVVANFCGSDIHCAQGGSVSVFLAKSSGGYRLASTQPVGAGTSAVALADLNGDGTLDVVALNRTDKTASILLGAGDGTLSPPTTFALQNSPIAFITGDFDHDGKTDLAVVSDCGSTQCSQPGTVDLLFGMGDGSFRPGPAYTVSYAPKSIAAGDLNGDGVADLVVANACGKDASCSSPGTATVLLGSAQGSFTALGDLSLGNAPSSVALKDLRGSGVLDLVVSMQGDDTVGVLKGGGDGSFQAPLTYAVGSGPHSVVISDFNGDGVPDVAVVNTKDSTVSVLYGKADGTLAAGEAYAVAAGPEALTAIAAKSGVGASLATANGNSAGSPLGSEITVLNNVAPSVGSTPSLTGLVVTTTAGTVNGAYTLTATVTPTPVGSNETVTFSSDDVGNLTDCPNPAALTLGVVSCTTHQLTAGSRTLTATYSGDATLAPSAGMQTATVAALMPTLSLTGPSVTPTVNQSATFTATLVLPAGGSFTPTVPSGTISFTINGQAADCSSTTLTGGNVSATCTTKSLTAASSTIVASYSGDKNYVVPGGSSSTLTQSVIPLAVGLAVTGPSTTPTVNSPSTFTATLTIPSGSSFTPVAPSGTISFTVNGNPADCATTTLKGGAVSATCTTSSLIAPTDTVAASYASDPNYAFTASSTSTLTQTVNPLAATLTFASTNPSNVNTPVTFTVTLNASALTPTVPTGTVSFLVRGNPLSDCPPVTLSGGGVTATCKTANLLVPADVITATYKGDNNFTVANPATVTQTVNQIAAATTLSTTTASPVVNQPITFTATVKGSTVGPVIPSGSLTFQQGGSTLCTSVGLTALTDGSDSSTASCTVSFPTASSTSLSVTTVYGGDQNFTAGVGATQSELVGAASTNLVLSSSGASTVNQAVTFTAVITPAFAGATKPGGTVNFVDQTTSPNVTLCSVTVKSDGTVPVCTVPLNTQGTHPVAATYTGNANFMTSSNSVSQIVGATGAKVGLASSNANPGVNQSLNLIATVTPDVAGTTTPQGKVTITDTTQSTVVCTPAVVNGVVASCSVSFATSGTHTLTAVFTSSDSNFTPDNTATLQQAVATAGTSLQLAPASTTAVVDQPVTLTATLVPQYPGAATPTGTVTFTDSQTGTIICTSSVSASGTIPNCVYSFLQPGSRTVTANFVPSSSSSNFGPSTSASVGVTIAKATPSVAVATVTPSASVVNQPVVLTATLTPPFADTGLTIPSGTVTYSSGATTFCSVTVHADGSVPNCTAPLGAVGTYPISVNYSGDSNFNPAASATPSTATVTQASTTLTLTPSLTTIRASQMVTYTATVSPVAPSQSGPIAVAGSVAFTIGGGGVPQGSCQSGVVPVASSTATCTVLYATGSANAITVSAAFTPSAQNGVINFAAPPSATSSTVTVEDFAIQFSVNGSSSAPAGPIFVTQGYSSQNDPFDATPIAIVVTPLSGFADALTYACQVTASNPTSGTGLTCTQGASSGAPSFVLSASASATVGTYTVVVTAIDPLSGSTLTRSAAPLTVQVGRNVPTLFLAQGVSGTANVPFAVGTPADTFSFACPQVFFSGNPSTLLKCTPAATGSLTSGTAAFTIATQGSVAMVVPVLKPSSRVFAATLLGLPLLALAGCFGRRSSIRKRCGRLLALAVVLVALSQAVGCGGGFTTPTTNTGTPTGTYLIQAIATDTTAPGHPSYHSVINVVVQ